MAKTLAVVGLLLVLSLTSTLAAGAPTRKLLQTAGTCSGTPLKCGLIINNHDLCSKTPGCQAGRFGNNFNVCYTIACNTFTTKPGCTQVDGCIWSPASVAVKKPTATKPAVTAPAPAPTPAPVINTCSGTVAANCGGILNNHDLCNATPGCEGGHFGNNFGVCFAKACPTFGNQAACTQAGCTWGTAPLTANPAATTNAGTPTATPAATTTPTPTPRPCSGTVTANCAGVKNNHDACNQLAGCAAGQFGNNFNTCYALACGTLCAQATCIQAGCIWTPPTQG